MSNDRPTDPASRDHDSSSPDSQPLYADRVRVYARNVHGTFRKLKWAGLWLMLGVYHIVPWLRWDRGEGRPDQAILLDLDGRRGYFFNIEIWPQEVYYLTGLLIIAAVGLFFVTSLFGRVWCGFACPQTVWTDLYMWVERVIEGDRNARMKLDASPLSVTKAAKKILKHTAYVIIGFLMSFAWVWYFNDAPTVTVDIVTGQAGSWVYTFIVGLTLMTYLLAGWAREQVCIYMCPWPRFQSAMFDEDSLIITYEEWRGEPRGKAPPSGDFSGRGHCVDCGMCVQVCPTGIDIRDGQQMQCIGCALCVDACNEIMDRFKLPRNLVTYDSISNQVARQRGQGARIRLLRPRTYVYMAVLTLVMLVMVFSFANRSRLEINVLHDRAPLFVTLSNGDLRNGYTFKILNMEPSPKTYSLSVPDLPGATLTALGITQDPVTSVTLPVTADEVGAFRIFVTSTGDTLSAGSNDITFLLKDLDSGQEFTQTSVFAAPGH